MEERFKKIITILKNHDIYCEDDENLIKEILTNNEGSDFEKFITLLPDSTLSLNIGDEPLDFIYCTFGNMESDASSYINIKFNECGDCICFNDNGSTCEIGYFVNINNDSSSIIFNDVDEKICELLNIKWAILNEKPYNDEIVICLNNEGGIFSNPKKVFEDYKNKISH